MIIARIRYKFNEFFGFYTTVIFSLRSTFSLKYWQKAREDADGILSSFWWTRPVIIRYHENRYMDSLAITGLNLGMARIVIGAILS